jgi:nicotinate-nucleotide adenylyltransferase
VSGAGAAGPAPDAAGAARPVVVFGGTFDPPHRRHVEVLRGVDALLKARQSIVVPAWRNPQREDAGASPADRLAMATLAFAPIADAVVVPWETERGAPCYSIDTVEDVLRRQRTGEVMQGPLRLVVGSDQALNFHTWRDWERLAELATPAVVLRPPHARETWPDAVRAAVPAPWADRWIAWTLPIDPVDVSGTEIRRRLAAGEPVDDLLPADVESYVRRAGLYGTAAKR